jgi:hypothetical protein
MQITSEQLWRAFADAVNDLRIWGMPISDEENAKEENMRTLFYIEGLRTMTKTIDDLLNGKE